MKINICFELENRVTVPWVEHGKALIFSDRSGLESKCANLGLSFLSCKTDIVTGTCFLLLFLRIDKRMLIKPEAHAVLNKGQ